ncbi:hypothetical protein K474DRAFT_1642880 [Panus rudis PR-1116 ss-1]|nr:hypothetical protein K474DRAFT_1642880 [Panus rudis PR-1116 ss-1]
MISRAIFQSLDPRPVLERKPHHIFVGPLYLEEDKSVKVPAAVNTFLRDYQREGIKFFYERYKQGRGGLLGDDMGLVGKTIQVISFLSAIMGKYGDKRDSGRRRKHVSRLQDGESWKKHRKLPPPNATWPTAVIIAPSSVLWNWVREIHKWGYFDVGVYSGPDRPEVLRDFILGRLDILVMSHTRAREDIEMLYDLGISVIVVDEVHLLKNPNSKTTKAYHRFECTVRFGLTGTAIQNSYGELWTILDWTYPGCVGSRKHWDTFVARPLIRGRSKSASEEEHLRAALVARILNEKVLPSYFLRRTKSIIQDQLPEKIDEVVFCPLSTKQVEVYKRIVDSDSVQNLIRKDEPCDCGSGAKRLKCCYPYESGTLLKYVSALIKVSNHLALILPSPKDSTEQIARNRELAQIAFPEGGAPKFGPALLVPQYCGKWIVLKSLLEKWREDRSNKVLIFTKSVKLLDMLEFQLSQEGLGFLRLQGSTKPIDRMPLIDRFHEDPDIFVFLISTSAGGTGLNLTGANKVVIFDPNWNPAYDLQAMDRAYRFGQTRNVEVYRLLGAGSIEELIYARQVYKQQQMAVGYNASFQTRFFDGVQGDKGRQGELFGIKNMFKLHEGTLATKMAIERATLTDLNWALAHMDSKPKKPSKQTRKGRGSKAEKDDDVPGLDGIESLFLDDRPPEEKKSTIDEVLSNIGIGYKHRNESLIKSNVIEEQRIQVMLEKKKKQAKEAQGSKSRANTSGPPAVQWPPKRKHHKPPPTAEEKLQARQAALLDLGIIANASQMEKFALEFVQKSEEEQKALIARLDQHTREMKKPGKLQTSL